MPSKSSWKASEMQKTKLFLKEQTSFIGLLAVGAAIAALVQGYPALAMWVGFFYAAYSVVANDSIQTIGTFLVSNKNVPWYVLFFYLGGILTVTSYYSWIAYTGDVTFGRLDAKGFEVAPASFGFLQLCAPLILLLLTRLGVPVSTTFLILSCFATSADGVGKVLLKSISGYGIAFLGAVLLWVVLTPVFRLISEGEAGRGWQVAQWVTSGCLWSVWLMQDAANVAIFLPRKLSLLGFLAYLIFLLGALALLVYQGGEKIQEVVEEKDNIQDIRQATVVDLLYAVILYYFKMVSNIPMSTTWVFIGLLAGREVAISIQNRARGQAWNKVWRMLAFDLAKVTLGLVVSVLLALVANPMIAETLL